MSRCIRPLAACLLLAAVSPLSAAGYAIKTTDAEPPEQVKEAIRSLLAPRAIQLLDPRGEAVLELWFRKEVPVKATAEQVKNGLTYRELPVSTLVAVARVNKNTFDYRKQKIKPGVYTLRLATQPQDGDHMGTAPYSEFCLISPAADDVKPDLMEAKPLNELSARTTEGHPACLLLFPGSGAGPEAKLVNKGMGHWVLLLQLGVKAAGGKATLPIGLTLVGTSASA